MNAVVMVCLRRMFSMMMSLLAHRQDGNHLKFHADKIARRQDQDAREFRAGQAKKFCKSRRFSDVLLFWSFKLA